MKNTLLSVLDVSNHSQQSGLHFRASGAAALVCVAASIVLRVHLLLGHSVAAATTNDPEIVDHLQAYPRFVDAIRHAEDAKTKRAVFKRYIHSRDPALHDAVIGNPDSISDDAFSRIMGIIIDRDDEIRFRRRMLLETIPETMARMHRVLDADFHGVSSHITLSLLSTNGQVRHHQGRYIVVYRVDTIAHQDGLFLKHHSRDVRVLVAHKLFHVHHWNNNPFMAVMGQRFLPPQADAPIWANMWSEGLAACVSRIAYPDSPIAIALSMKNIWSRAGERLPVIAAELNAVLDSNAPDVTAEWFYLNNCRDDLPDKAAYVMGAIVAHHIVGRRGLDAVVKLEGDALREAITESLRVIGEGQLKIHEEALCVVDVAETA